MDLQTRKLNAIEYLIHLQDEDVFKQIEEAIFKAQDTNKSSLKPFTKKQLIERAKKANSDYLSGKFKSQDQLEIDAKNW